MLQIKRIKGGLFVYREIETKLTFAGAEFQLEYEVFGGLKTESSAETEGEIAVKSSLEDVGGDRTDINKPQRSHRAPEWIAVFERSEQHILVPKSSLFVSSDGFVASQRAQVEKRNSVRCDGIRGLAGQTEDQRSVIEQVEKPLRIRKKFVKTELISADLVVYLACEAQVPAGCREALPISGIV